MRQLLRGCAAGEWLCTACGSEIYGSAVAAVVYNGNWKSYIATVGQLF
jgi:ribosomal protein L37AE/L43A